MNLGLTRRIFVIALSTIPVDATVAQTDEFGGLFGWMRRGWYVGESFRYEYAIRDLVSFPVQSLDLTVDVSFDGMPVLHVDRVTFTLDGRRLAVLDPYFVWVLQRSPVTHAIPSQTVRVDELAVWQRIEALDGASLRALFRPYESAKSAASLDVFDRLADREDTPLTVEWRGWKRTTGALAWIGPTTRRALGIAVRNSLLDSEDSLDRCVAIVASAKCSPAVAWTLRGEHPATAIESEQWPRGFSSIVNSRLRTQGSFLADRDRFYFQGRTLDLEIAIARAAALSNTAIEIAFHADANALPSSLTEPASPDDADWSLTATHDPGASGRSPFRIRFDVAVSPRIVRDELNLPATIRVVADPPR